MKVAQLLATIPEAIPPEWAAELMRLQANAPAMGWAFVKRRMQAELGPDWQKRFGSFEHEPAHAASLGQVHRATTPDGAGIAENKVSPTDINATIGFALGLPLDQVIYSPTKRPFTVADKGQPLVNLFA